VIRSADPVNPIEVDARGLRCPLPVIRLAEAARDAPAGTRIVVLASDPAARYDIPAWCRMRDHELYEVAEVADPSGTDGPATEGAHQTCLRFVVLIGPQRSKAAGTGNGSERSSRAM
jgi:tRNA 2-thiouridine synthesizing protein A